jgi:HK97 gp10 family phage protein
MPAQVEKWKWKVPYRSKEWREVLHMDGLKKALGVFADEIKEKAEQSAPVYTGEYKDSFVTAVHDGRKRASVRLGNTADHAIFVEFGGDKTPAYHTLGNAAASKGKKVGGG